MKLDPKRILVVGREHIGDIVNTTPYLLALQAAYPKAEIVFEVGAGATQLLKNFPGLKEIWARPTHEGLSGKWKRIRQMRQGRFDWTVIFDDSRRFALEAWLAGIRFRSGIYRKGPRWLLSVSSDWSREGHDIFEPFGNLMKNLGVQGELPAPRIFPDDADREAATKAFQEFEEAGSRIVCLNPSTARHYNRWPSERWAELAVELQDIGFHPVLIGPPNDVDAHRNIVERSNGAAADRTGQLTLLQLYEFLRYSKYLVSVDTGTVHLGAAAGVPTVVLHGPADPHRYQPWGDRWETYQAPNRKIDSVKVEDALRTFEKLRARLP